MLPDICSKIALAIFCVATARVNAEENKNSSRQENSFSANSQPATNSLGSSDLKYQAYSPQDLTGTRLSDSCKSMLSTTLQCDPFVDEFRVVKYRGSLPDDKTTRTVCDQGCGVALGFWYHASQEACRDELLYDAPATIVPGRIWQGWNETCIIEPKTNMNCNDVIAKFPDVDFVENMNNAQLCSFCWVRKHAIMRSPYSIYNSYHQHVLETINSRCGLSIPTSIPAPVIPLDEPKSTFCATAQTYVAVQGDSCSSIAIAKNMSSSSLWYANQNIIRNCTSIDAGTRLCLPYSCPQQYRVQPGDTCDLIEIRQNLFYGTLRRYNSWLNDDCSNLHSGVLNMGNVICTTATGATNFALNPPKVISQPGSGPRSSE